MDVTEAQLAIALQEAFRCYLAFLSYDQKLRDSKLPRQGKGVETTADISTQQYYQSRITAIEASLQYIGKIARRVERWVYEPPEEYCDEEINAETEEENFEGLPNGQDSAYLDFFSGRLVYPTTPFSPGPSNSNDEAAAKEIDDQVHFEQARRPGPHVTIPDGMDNEVDEDVPEVRGRELDANPSSRTYLGIHPNTPISVNGKSPKLSYSAPSSKAPSFRQKTPTSSISANEVDNESSAEESEEDESSEESEEEEEDHGEEEEEDEDEDYEEEDEVEGSDSSQEESDESEGEDDTNSVHPEITAAFQLQGLQDVHDADHAKRIHTAEAKEAEEVDKKLAQARKLAEQWARDDEARLLRQKKYAEELRQQERERQERIQKEIEAALKARKEQDEWELAAIARETAAMRAEERKRRGEAEAKRVAEQERRSRIEREKQWAEEIKQRNAEEKRKREEEDAQRRQQEVEEAERRQRDAEEAQRRQREVEEAQRRQKDREKRKRTIIIDCLACMEPGDREDMAVLPCRHAYCGDCVKDAFKSAYKSRTQFKCCGIPVSAENAPIARYLSPSFTHKYTNLLLELSTRHPKYCSSPSCSRFLPPTLYNAPSITCPKCKTRTCTLCTQREHAGVCKQDKDGIRVEKLARRKGWKKCPGCSQVVERTEGCLHITCRCGAEWCYACLRDWGECGSACGREPRMEDGYDRGEGQADRPPRVAPLVAGAVFIGLAMLRERGMRQ